MATPGIGGVIEITRERKFVGRGPEIVWADAGAAVAPSNIATSAAAIVTRSTTRRENRSIGSTLER